MIFPALIHTVAATVYVGIFVAGTKAVTFYPNANLSDTSGNIIQAHGGAIIQDKNALLLTSIRYWFGQNDSADTNFDAFEGTPCYKTTDFNSWEYLGLALSPQPGTNISNDSVVEREKVLYNAKNSEYVMWFHSDNADYSLATVGVATSKHIAGPYEFQGNFHPLGHQSRDMTVWQDPDTDEAYLVFATDNNANLAIASLNSDYTNVTAILYNFTNVYWEAPGVFKYEDKFYLLVSPQNGWTPTPNLWMTAPSMSGPWTSAADLAPSDAYTYLTQNAYDIVIEGTKETTHVYLGDRWNGNELYSSTYSFMPLVFENGNLTIHNTGGWTLDVQTGEWWDLKYSSITAAKSTSSQLVSCSDECPGGEAAKMTNTQDFSCMFQLHSTALF
ncbi:glycoside hydrolase family 43 protein [Acidomyces richmondensis BFW]|nr:glycoside hydrolase family 43 protein [Acidomyces richmondensis BFW]